MLRRPWRNTAANYDVVFVVADGLSARAVAVHAQPVLALAIEALRAEDFKIAPLVVALQGRVAIGDAIANALGAASVAVLIGERPGLSAPDSMGAYLTWHPHAGTSDAERNCISNIRPRRHRLRCRRVQDRAPACAPCARGNSPACSSRTIRIGYCSAAEPRSESGWRVAFYCGRGVPFAKAKTSMRSTL